MELPTYRIDFKFAIESRAIKRAIQGDMRCFGADIDNSYADNGKIGDNGNGNNNATDDNSNIKNGNGDAVSGSAQQHAYRHLTYDQWYLTWDSYMPTVMTAIHSAQCMGLFMEWRARDANAHLDFWLEVWVTLTQRREL
ncbi:MAG: hypothetical protein FRX49_03084 [Trebouxia sp. A1-2]|nr:MAG: hypothetical protein FRX49_03084 [Trebouxia sp. A1-2]